jgi:putative tricarboxylic transport membrane protein
MIDFGAAYGAMTLLGSSAEAWTYIVPGLLLGLIAGAIPGLSVVVAMALVLPLIQYMDFLPGVIFITAIFTGGGFGCAIPAILMNIPGSSTAVGTTFDGYPMTRNGEAGRALGLALSSSVIGTLGSYLTLFFFIQTMAALVLKLGPSEMFLVAVWGLSLIAILSGGNVAKGILAGIVGVLLGTVGMNAMGVMRGTMGSMHLLAGISTVPAMMALFAAPEMLSLAAQRRYMNAQSSQSVGVTEIVRGMREVLRHPVILLRGALIGTVIGAVPGVGASIANLVSYAETRRRADTPETFGKGDPRGVIASEAANSSSEGGGLATLLTLGIPGGGCHSNSLGGLFDTQRDRRPAVRVRQYGYCLRNRILELRASVRALGGRSSGNPRGRFGRSGEDTLRGAFCLRNDRNRVLCLCREHVRTDYDAGIRAAGLGSASLQLSDRGRGGRSASWGNGRRSTGPHIADFGW